MNPGHQHDQEIQDQNQARQIFPAIWIAISSKAAA
jgi:hypothetical protein